MHVACESDAKVMSHASAEHVAPALALRQSLCDMLDDTWQRRVRDACDVALGAEGVATNVKQAPQANLNTRTRLPTALGKDLKLETPDTWVDSGSPQAPLHVRQAAAAEYLRFLATVGTLVGSGTG